MERINIYVGREKSYQNELKRLENANIMPENKQLIKGFQKHLLSTGRTGQERAAKLSGELRRICLKYNKNMALWLRNDAEDVISEFNGLSGNSEATQSDYRAVIKQFYRWFKKQDLRLESDDKQTQRAVKGFYEYLEDDVSTSYDVPKADPKTIISDDDCNYVLENGCKSAKEKAFVSMLHETGCRAGEFLNIQTGDIDIKDNHAEIRVDGKTGKRTIFIVKSLPYLLRWLDIRPKETEYLWITESTNHSGKPLKHRAADKMIDLCFERAKLNKKHNMHWFRHSRATILAPKITTPILCRLMGWTLNSKQIKTYCHLSVKDVEDIFLSINGIKPKEDKSEQPIKCICGTLNNPNERYCYKCCKPLKVETIIQDQAIVNSEISKTMQFFMEMAKNPEMMKRFEEFNALHNKSSSQSH